MSAANGPYVSRHGFGYSVFEHTENGIRSELWVYVALDALGQVHGAQGAQRLRPIAATVRHRLCGMGAGRPAAKIGMHVVTEVDPTTGALVRAESLQHGIRRIGSPSSTWMRATRSYHRRPH